MAMSVGSSNDGAMCDINTTPLIDVMLVLLIMFIITIPVMTHAVKLDMPRPTNAPPPPVQPEVIDIEIDFDGTIVWNGTAGRVTEGPAAGIAYASRQARQVRHRRPGARFRAAQPYEEDRFRERVGVPGLRRVNAC